MLNGRDQRSTSQHGAREADCRGCAHQHFRGFRLPPATFATLSEGRVEWAVLSLLGKLQLEREGLHYECFLPEEGALRRRMTLLVSKPFRSQSDANKLLKEAKVPQVNHLWRRITCRHPSATTWVIRASSQVPLPSHHCLAFSVGCGRLGRFSKAIVLKRHLSLKSRRRGLKPPKPYPDAITSWRLKRWLGPEDLQGLFLKHAKQRLEKAVPATACTAG